MIARTRANVQLTADPGSGGALLVDDDFVAARLNATGYLILTMAEQNTSWPALVTAFAAAAQCTAGEAEPVIEKFLRELDNDGWIEHFQGPGHTGLARDRTRLPWPALAAIRRACRPDGGRA